MPSSAAAIVAEARTWLGTPWRHQGAVKGVGCDCVGLVRGVGEAAGALTVDPGLAKPFAGYSAAPGARRIVKACDIFLRRLKAPPAPGDVLLFAVKGQPMHLGILSEPGVIIHADRRFDRVVENRIDPAFHICGAWRYPGIA